MKWCNFISKRLMTSAKTFFWRLFNAMTQEQKGILWPFFLQLAWTAYNRRAAIPVYHFVIIMVYLTDNRDWQEMHRGEGGHMQQMFQVRTKQRMLFSTVWHWILSPEIRLSCSLVLKSVYLFWTWTDLLIYVQIMEYVYWNEKEMRSSSAPQMLHQRTWTAGCY